MQTANKNGYQQEWIKILTKGMITIPKSFRDELSLREGEVARIKKVGRRLIIEPLDVIDYEIYGDKEFKEMLRDDKLPPKLAKQAATFWRDMK